VPLWKPRRPLASSRRPSGKVRVGDQPREALGELEHRLHLWPIYRRSTEKHPRSVTQPSTTSFAALTHSARGTPEIRTSMQCPHVDEVTATSPQTGQHLCGLTLSGFYRLASMRPSRLTLRPGAIGAAPASCVLMWNSLPAARCIGNLYRCDGSAGPAQRRGATIPSLVQTKPNRWSLCRPSASPPHPEAGDGDLDWRFVHVADVPTDPALVGMLSQYT
jgi:hypothetical protein